MQQTVSSSFILLLLLLWSQSTTFAFVPHSWSIRSSRNTIIPRSAKEEEEEEQLKKENDNDDNNNGGSSGYKFGDLSRGLANRFTKRVQQVTGNESYQFGDLSRHLDQTAKEQVSKLTGKETYEFGDLSRWADTNIKQKVCEMTGKEEYQVGDISSEVVRRVLAGEVQWDEVLMLVKVLISLGASFSPIAGMLPARALINLLNYSIAAQVGEKVTESITTELDRRMKKAVTGDPEYQLGDFTKSKLLKFVGKDPNNDGSSGNTNDNEYQFGDLTKTIMKQMKDTTNSNNKNQGFLLFGDDKKTASSSSSSSGLELNDSKILEELAKWDKAFKIENKEPPKK